MTQKICFELNNIANNVKRTFIINQNGVARNIKYSKDSNGASRIFYSHTPATPKGVLVAILNDGKTAYSNDNGDTWTLNSTRIPSSIMYGTATSGTVMQYTSGRWFANKNNLNNGKQTSGAYNDSKNCSGEWTTYVINNTSNSNIQSFAHSINGYLFIAGERGVKIRKYNNPSTDLVTVSFAPKNGSDYSACEYIPQVVCLDDNKYVIYSRQNSTNYKTYDFLISVYIDDNGNIYGRNKYNDLNAPASGNYIEGQNLVIFEYDDGKISTEWVAYSNGYPRIYTVPITGVTGNDLSLNSADREEIQPVVLDTGVKSNGVASASYKFYTKIGNEMYYLAYERDTYPSYSSFCYRVKGSITPTVVCQSVLSTGKSQLLTSDGKYIYGTHWTGTTRNWNKYIRIPINKSVSSSDISIITTIAGDSGIYDICYSGEGGIF